ncbi:MAG: hypothetical protein XD60_0770 [Acetothermia bacterium 64_32]|nr:MAG: hypothetical protein XD60_0770 [Acetothermia bacterium 64_32]
MQQYASEGERRFLEVNYETHPELEYEAAGAFLLARDLHKHADESRLIHIRADVETLLADEGMSSQRELGLRFDPLLRAFRLGLEESLFNVRLQVPHLQA